VNAGGDSADSNLITAGPPGVLDASFNYDRPDQQIVIRFSSDVSASLASGLLLVNTTTGQTIPLASVAIQFNAADNSATVSFPGLPGGSLPDGRYRLTLRAADIVNRAGLHLDGNGDGVTGDDFVYNFHQLAGDANRDGAVNFNDLVPFAQNYNTPGGKTWAQGDFTGDGKVDFADMVKIAQNYNKSLPGAAAPIAGAGLSFAEVMAAAFAPAAMSPSAPVAAAPASTAVAGTPKAVARSRNSIFSTRLMRKPAVTKRSPNRARVR
jgi:hypothetical protein